MIKSTNLNIRIDKNVKETSERIFTNLGINMSTAINMFLHQVIRTNSIPFDLINDEVLEENCSENNPIEKIKEGIKNVKIKKN